MGKIKLALAQSRGQIEETLSVLNKFSVSWIELRTGFLGAPTKVSKRTKEVLKGSGIGIACITNGFTFIREMVERPAQYIQTMKETIDVAKELGAPFVNCYAYYFAWGHNADISRFIEVMRPIVKYAEKMDITVVLENEAHDASGTPEGTLRILKALESDHFRANFDPTNYYQANVEPYPYAYEMLRKYIAYVHVKNGCQYIPEVHPEHWMNALHTFAPPNDSNYIFYPTIPDGAVNIEGFLARLKRDGYSGFCTLEPHVKPNKLMDYYKIEIPYMKKKGIT